MHNRLLVILRRRRETWLPTHRSSYLLETPGSIAASRQIALSRQLWLRVRRKNDLRTDVPAALGTEIKGNYLRWRRDVAG